MPSEIHPTAIIEDGAQLGNDVRIGPYCVIGKNVVLGDGVILESHVVLAGHTTLGPRCHVYPFASIGHAPQDLKYHGEASTLSIGSDTIIREHVTLQPGTEGGGMQTTIGSHCLFMVNTHVAHDCHVGDHVIMANNATLAGHVTLGDHVIMGGTSGVHQFVRVGDHAFIGGMAGVENDVIPYGAVIGERAWLAGLNLVGLKRRGFDREAIHRIRALYKSLFEDSKGSFAERLADAIDNAGDNAGDEPEIRMFLDFLQAENGGRAVCQPRQEYTKNNNKAAA